MDDVEPTGSGPSSDRATWPAVAGPPADPDAGLDDATRTTYRYLRVSVVALALLLTVSLVLEIVRGNGERFGSISGYYYSPVRSVLVGTLVAIGPALIAIKGRTGWDDTLLDLAGMAVPVVAFVPTPRHLGTAVCGHGAASCVPPEFVPEVRNNVAALLVVGAAVLVFAWRGARRRRGRPAFAGRCAATLAWAVVTVWFTVAPDGFLRLGHYAAALVFFLLTAAVAWRAGRHAGERAGLPLMSPDRYRAAYRTVSALIVATLAGAALLLGVGRLLGLHPWFATVFVVEAVLLALFVAFWVLQTVENWDEEPLERQADGADGDRRPSSRP